MHAILTSDYTYDIYDISIADFITVPFLSVNLFTLDLIRDVEHFCNLK